MALNTTHNSLLFTNQLLIGGYNLDCMVPYYKATIFAKTRWWMWIGRLPLLRRYRIRVESKRKSYKNKTYFVTSNWKIGAFEIYNEMNRWSVLGEMRTNTIFKPWFFRLIFLSDGNLLFSSNNCDGIFFSFRTNDTTVDGIQRSVFSTWWCLKLSNKFDHYFFAFIFWHGVRQWRG